MATSQLQVVNQVLNQLGRTAVSAIADQPDALLIQQSMNLMLPALLLAADWNFAIVYRSDSTPITQNFSPEYVYTYQLPADYARMDRFWQCYFQYRLIDGLLLSNQLPINYYYVSNNADYSVITPLFSLALTYMTAAEVCDVLTNNDALTKKLLYKFENAKADAILQNDMERQIQTMPRNDYDRTNYV